MAEKSLAELLGDYHYRDGRNLLSGRINFTNTFFIDDLDGPTSQLQVLSDLIHLGKTRIDQLEINLVAAPGGQVDSALALYDMIRQFAWKHELPVVMKVSGVCASAAAQIVLHAGDVRIASPSSVFMLHEISKFSFGSEKRSSISDAKVGMDMLTDRMYNIMAERCEKDVSEVRQMIDRRTVWMTAEEALDWGLIDEISDY